MPKTLHVLGLSGGKDSAALAMYMRDNYPELDIQYYFTDTGKELPEVIDFVNRLEGYLGKPIIDPYDEVFSSNRTKKDFDYHLEKHQNYLPSPQARWCTIQMKLVPFEMWINKKMMDEGYDMVISYVGIRADEPARTGFLTNSNNEAYLKIEMPFRDDGLNKKDIFDILQGADLLSDTEEVINYRKLFIDKNTNMPTTPTEEDVIKHFENEIVQTKNSTYKDSNLTVEIYRKIVEAMDVGKPGYYGWRSRSGCTFCFYQQKIEWVRLKQIYPAAFEEAKSYEKTAEEKRPDGTFYWLGKDTPLSTLEDPDRIVQIEANHAKRMERFAKKARRRQNQLQINIVNIDTDVMDEIYDEVEGGGACVTCYK